MSAVKFAIIGCGLIGKKRLAGLPADSLAVACDLDVSRAESLVHAAKCGRATQDFHDAVSDPAVDAVIVSTLNGTLAEISLAALRAGKHVLVEKPGALTAQQMEPLAAEAAARKLCVRIGYNHRFHPAFQKAREIFDSGALGELMFIRGRYGHGGRIGYDREWRADPALSGGGELIDQGVHLIDLARWFLGDFTTVEGHTATFFWDMPVDDNAFLSLRTATGRRRGCTRAARNGKTFSPSRSTGATRSCTSKVSAAATAWSGCTFTRCCRRWGLRRRRSGNIRTAINPGRRRHGNSCGTSGNGVPAFRALPMRRRFCGLCPQSMAARRGAIPAEIAQ